MVELFTIQDIGRVEGSSNGLNILSSVFKCLHIRPFILNQTFSIMAKTKSLVFSPKALKALSDHFQHVLESDGGISRIRSGMVYGQSHLLAAQDKHPVPDDEALKISNAYKDHNQIYDIIEDAIDFGEIEIK